jgi:hypothetical protein
MTDQRLDTVVGHQLRGLGRGEAQTRTEDSVGRGAGSAATARWSVDAPADLVRRCRSAADSAASSVARRESWANRRRLLLV